MHRDQARHLRLVEQARGDRALHALRHRVAGRDGVDADADVGPLDREHPRQPLDARLRGAVGEALRDPDLRGDRRDADDRRRVRLRRARGRRRGSTGTCRRGGRRAERRPGRRRCTLLRRLRVDRAGDVDERVEPPELLERPPRPPRRPTRSRSRRGRTASARAPLGSSRAATSPASASSMSPIATLQPRPTNASAIAMPIPRAAPADERDALLRHSRLSVCAGRGSPASVFRVSISSTRMPSGSIM